MAGNAAHTKHSFPGGAGAKDLGSLVVTDCAKGVVSLHYFYSEECCCVKIVKSTYFGRESKEQGECFRRKQGQRFSYLCVFE